MSQLRFRSERLAGWGRFPVEPCHLYRPEKRSDVAAILASNNSPSYVARGLGRSYGDAALNRDAGVISQLRLNHFLGFDAQAGALECESGVSFAEIIEYFLPRGFFLPVTPGTKFVTVGGAIAADVHGKNHHRDGTIANFVTDLRLLTASGCILTCSPNENTDVFWATVGGMGLTGVILSARLKLRRVEAAYVQASYQKARSFGEALDAMAESDSRYRYSVAWLDCVARGREFGRAVLIGGNHVTAEEVPARLGDPLELPRRTRRRVPLDLPAWALSRSVASAFNALYYRRRRASGLVDLDRFFYPLDAVADWNRLYGKRGFVQYQVALPEDEGREALAKLLRRLADSPAPPFLAVLKRFGEGNPGLLSFPMKGYTLAVDTSMTRDVIRFLHGLDAVALDCGGRVYLAKDAVMRPETFAASYPRLEEFRVVKARLDPKGALSSSLARRLKIC